MRDPARAVLPDMGAEEREAAHTSYPCPYGWNCAGINVDTPICRAAEKPTGSQVNPVDSRGL